MDVVLANTYNAWLVWKQRCWLYSMLHGFIFVSCISPLLSLCFSPSFSCSFSRFDSQLQWATVRVHAGDIFDHNAFAEKMYRDSHVKHTHIRVHYNHTGFEEKKNREKERKIVDCSSMLSYIWVCHCIRSTIVNRNYVHTAMHYGLCNECIRPHPSWRV